MDINDKAPPPNRACFVGGKYACFGFNTAAATFGPAWPIGPKAKSASSPQHCPDTAPLRPAIERPETGPLKSAYGEGRTEGRRAPPGGISGPPHPSRARVALSCAGFTNA
jgi:hypothetical protein